jgi:hypothetical protein
MCLIRDLKVKEVRSSETPEKYQATRRHISEYSILRSRHRDNHNAINKERSIFGKCLVPCGSEYIFPLS